MCNCLYRWICKYFITDQTNYTQTYVFIVPIVIIIVNIIIRKIINGEFYGYLFNCSECVFNLPQSYRLERKKLLLSCLTFIFRAETIPTWLTRESYYFSFLVSPMHWLLTVKFVIYPLKSAWKTATEQTQRKIFRNQ